MQRILTILRARRIDRVAAMYLVAGWVAVQAASIALPAFSAPEWVLRAFIIAVVLGLPAALGIAWAAAPHLDPAIRVATPESRRDAALAATIGIVVLAILFQLIYGAMQKSPVAMSSLVPEPRLAAPRPASIAVLPFTSMSERAGNRYFSEGISAELITRLAQNPNLRVVGRASSFRFEGSKPDIATIARTLHVGAVLDGSVREEGDRVRIDAELVNASDGFTLWSHSYDGDLTHILDLQDEIARAISEALTHRLLNSASHPGTIDPDAYHRYLEARYALTQHSDAALARAIALFSETTRLAPDFADGHAGLGHALMLSATGSGHREHVAPGEAAIARALKLDPGNAEALSIKGWFALLRWDWTAVAEDALEMRNRGDADSLNTEAVLLKYLDFPEQSLAAARAATRLNPLVSAYWANTASSLIATGQYREASQAATNARALAADEAATMVVQCGAFAHDGRIPEARRIAAALSGARAQQCRFEIAIAEGARGEAHALADALAKSEGSGIAGLRESTGQYYLLCGDMNQALSWFERDYAARQPGLLAVLFDIGTPKSLLSAPRWKLLMQRPLLKSWQAAHDRVAAALAEKG